MATRVEKQCVICGRDCSNRPRTRDPIGRYACSSCYAKACSAHGHGESADTSDLSSELTPEIVDEVMTHAPDCPRCGTAREPGTVVCVNCGYDTRTGDRLEVHVEGSVTAPAGCESSTAMWDRIIARARGDAVRKAWSQAGWSVVVIVAGLAAMAFASTPDDTGLAARVAAHLPKLGTLVASGGFGLWIASRIWLGGVGPLPLAVLRLAAVYAGAYAVTLYATPLPFDGWFVTIAAYLVLLMWIFRLGVIDTWMLAVLTIGLHVGAGLAVPALMP
jgi:hypothetical protein